MSSIGEEHHLEEQRTPRTRQESVPEEAERIDQRSPIPYSDENAQRKPDRSTSNRVIENTLTKQKPNRVMEHTLTKNQYIPVNDTKQTCRLSIGSYQTATVSWKSKQL